MQHKEKSSPTTTHSNSKFKLGEDHAAARVEEEDSSSSLSIRKEKVQLQDEEEEEGFQDSSIDQEGMIQNVPNDTSKESLEEEHMNQEEEEDSNREKEIENIDQEENNSATCMSRMKRVWKRAGQVPVLKHVVGFLSTYGAIFLFNHAFRSLFFMNLISGLGNFFSEIAIVNLLETRTANSTLSSNSTSLSIAPMIHSPFYSSIYDTFSPNKDVDIPNADYSHDGASGTAISGVFIALLLPGIFLMPITGIVADLFDRRKILLASDIARGFIVLLFLIAYFINGLEWLVYLTIFLQYCFGAFFEPSREALVPLVVKQEDLPIANALDSLCWLAVSFFGSSLGGLVVSLLGIPANFAFDSASFFISGFFCLLLFQYKHLGRRGIDDRKVEPPKKSNKEDTEMEGH
ncbi:hypothetical protein C9374_002932 [Naegleria lovaniensis]|uniref:Major facilitator superfamily (MFS) profile domain-containing protein n=1 Tax=Naegleria lovaniensis TaxID=51637 RepID=A0AA88GTK8_NAELO|nr:uncharacterized protein C9374_002932 [Naegleria lovaniensis]KAG2385783.1 hypothetical protein C9374_002932 [Naegleria lovaniensis]